MDANKREFLNDVAEKVVGAAYEVANILGSGFLEKVYERALCAELRRRGIRVQSQVPIIVYCKGEVAGEYFADLLVEEALIVELKCANCLSDEHLAKCLNYLKATNHHLALMINFQYSRIEWKRVVWNF